MISINIIMYVHWALNNLINDISSLQYYELNNKILYTIINNNIDNYIILYYIKYTTL